MTGRLIQGTFDLPCWPYQLPDRAPLSVATALPCPSEAGVCSIKIEIERYLAIVAWQPTNPNKLLCSMRSDYIDDDSVDSVTRKALMACERNMTVWLAANSIRLSSSTPFSMEKAIADTTRAVRISVDEHMTAIMHDDFPGLQRMIKTSADCAHYPTEYAL